MEYADYNDRYILKFSFHSLINPDHPGMVNTNVFELKLREVLSFTYG